MDRDKFILYIDESGIHKSAEHSSFVIVYIRVYDKDFVKKELVNIEESLHIAYFHWSNFSTKYGWGIRKKFVEKTKKLPFTFKYRILKNPVKPTKELYNSLFMLLDENMIEEIFIDGNQPKWFERHIKKSLRDRGFSIKTVRIVDDKKEPLIRLADALSNIVRIYHDRPAGLIIELFNSVIKKNISR